ncbi:MAG: Rne/Rng family ribonuclease [Alphaproteobacteria bacterium]|nr:Rne/Rng family ribonuclease [Alphaproteobacteria bacterium]MCB9984145.1 Rne/Rng family ribonuclease [Micavibrio sp.]
MAKRMLIDATHAEETRVAVVDGNKLIEFDYESKVRKQIKGNIFLAKVTRVEPSLQAAFVNYGGNRHGFLPFSEIHPDYFRIPIADREALLAAQQEEYEAAMAAEEAAIAAEEASLTKGSAKEKIIEESGASVDTSIDESDSQPAQEQKEPTQEDHEEQDETLESSSEEDEDESEEDEEAHEETEEESTADTTEHTDPSDDANAETKPVQHKFKYRGVTEIDPETLEILETDEKDSLSFDQDLAIKIEELAKAREDVVRARLHYRHSENGVKKRSVWIAYHADNEDVDHEQALAQEEEAREKRQNNRRGRGGGRYRGRGRNNNNRKPMQNRQVELVGGEGVDNDQPFRPSLHRNYKIQEVIKRGQIMLIQVQKEERGNKGAAVTTYLSLPGRYCVLMPNSARGGGVSRKIASFAERKRMREILRELGTPDGMSVILRTAGVERAHDEIKRDLDYLMRLWNNIRDLTLVSSAPAMIYEEGDLVKRAVRDIYASEIEEILVSGNDGHKQAKDFMKLLMPTSVKKIKQYKEDKIPLFHRYQVENQIAEMGEPVVTLKSGGYLVINPTEALVSIDVNSGRATKERHIEETAVKTNLEAADEVARQLRLRDLGGLVVIDFIDMEENRNNAKVERRLREALSTDRARIQVGRISSFGLLELSRQRLNPSLTEAQFEKCPHCKGIGNIRSVDSATIMALRGLEEEGIRSRASQVFLSVPNSIALYILNQKRDMLAGIERRYGFTVFVRVDDELAPTGYKIEAIKAVVDEDAEDDQVINSEDDNNQDSENNSETVDSEDEEEKPARSRHRQKSDSKSDDESKSQGNRSRSPKGRGRKPRSENDSEPQEKLDQKQVKSDKETPKNQEASQPSVPQSSGIKAKRFGSSKSKSESTPQPAETVPAPKVEIVPSSPSNDVGELENGDDPQSRKKGWWNRLIEK